MMQQRFLSLFRNLRLPSHPFRESGGKDGVTGNSYSVFALSLYRRRDAKWIFSQEKSTLHTA